MSQGREHTNATTIHLAKSDPDAGSSPDGPVFKLADHTATSLRSRLELLDEVLGTHT